MNSDPAQATTARALWYEAPQSAGLRLEALPQPGPAEARVATRWSALSRGTERLIFEGRVPVSERQRMRGPFQQGDFPFPVKYGYCAAGVVEAGPPDWLGKEVFCLHPHQDRFVAPLAALRPVPSATPLRRAPLAANMETALNALWDSGAGPGDRIVIVGAGVLGLLIAYLAARLPGSEPLVIDKEAARQDIATAFGASFQLAGEFEPEAVEADVVFHASATAGGLALALASAGFEAKVVETSWHGEGDTPTPLGGAFHAKRLQLISSQVGQLSPSRRPRWTYARRLDKALELLADPLLDALISEEVDLEATPRELPRLLGAGARGLATLIRY
ncbi:zinc-dependent alcohol dehydrogenase [Methylocystis bryophila]|uniref:Dehydrogenase n=1 Tax=Methylocystis bryophila TaxID=655015 RepID=A0A1W6MUH4_9HYPH|nr:zinc-binding alcohol dehydrogenase [Methylocystis bryophila]ARN81156.1 dehydrogenase [Methylocystis bryophila]BDV37090.1 dehydrogenase [Methylocystis bryophila]